MIYFLDTEFVDDGNTIDLISIGIVSSDGREYYAQSIEFHTGVIPDFVREQVLPHLQFCSYNGKLALATETSGKIVLSKIHHSSVIGQAGKCYLGTCPWRTRKQIKDEIITFINPETYGKPTLISWCGSYDHVVFCQLFGPMMDLPAGYPHHIKEFQEALATRGIADAELPPQEEGVHNALADARHLKRLWGYIVNNDGWQ